MRKITHYARASALPAIAAALALSSTPSFAQEAVPQTQPVIEPVPATTPDPPPTTDATSTTTESSTPAADTTATTPEAAPVATTTTTKRSTRTTATKPAATPARTVTTRTTTTRTNAPAAPAPTPASESAVQPAVDVNANPPSAATAAAEPATNNDNTLPIVAGGALALLALGGGAVALARRRRRQEEDEWIEEEAMTPEPVETVAIAEPRHDPIVHEEQPAIVAPAASAFSWGNPQPAARAPMDDRTSADPEDDRMPGESWIERAYRGPTPNNPSVSLRARLKRAAFFDKRERDVVAGRSEPVEMDAGLPEAMVDEQERELA
jgi:resuscitation-promoting factor RpfA